MTAYCSHQVGPFCRVVSLQHNQPGRTRYICQRTVQIIKLYKGDNVVRDLKLQRSLFTIKKFQLKDYTLPEELYRIIIMSHFSHIFVLVFLMY